MEDRPVRWDEGRKAWRVTGYDAAVRVMRDPVSFTVDDPRFSTARVVGPSMLSLDGEDHRRHRTPFTEPFRPREIEARFGAFVEAETDRLLALAYPARRADLRPALANPLATAVVAQAIGLDGSDPSVVAALARWYAAIVESVSDASTGREPTEAGRDAFEALRDSLLGHVGQENSPSVLGTAGTAQLSADEIVSNAAVMLFGGIETTEGMILNLVWHLLTSPPALAAVRRDPALVADAVEESLRLEPAAAVLDRYATTHVTLDGVAIREGDMVTVSLREANRDPAVFADPERFDVRRPNVRRQLAFAQGPHACLGADLARLETRAAVRLLLDRLPGIRLDSAVDQRGPEGDVFRKPSSLVVVW